MAVFELGEYASVEFSIVMGDSHYEDLDFSAIGEGTRVQAYGRLGDITGSVHIEEAHDLTVLSEE